MDTTINITTQKRPEIRKYTKTIYLRVKVEIVGYVGISGNARSAWKIKGQFPGFLRRKEKTMMQGVKNSSIASSVRDRVVWCELFHAKCFPTFSRVCTVFLSEQQPTCDSFPINFFSFLNRRVRCEGERVRDPRIDPLRLFVTTSHYSQHNPDSLGTCSKTKNLLGCMYTVIALFQHSLKGQKGQKLFESCFD